MTNELTDDQQPAGPPLLDLSAEPEDNAPRVRLPGTSGDHRLRMPTEMPLRDQITIQRIAARLAILSDPDKARAEEATDAEADAIMQRIDRMVALVLPDAPQEALAALTDGQKRRVLDYYLSFAMREQRAETAAP